MASLRTLSAISMFCVVTATSTRAQPTRQPAAWETCQVVEGKDDRCAAGEEPKPFEYYLHPELWQKAVQELMVSGGEFARHKPTWREVGLLGPMRIRAVRYPSGEEPWALDIVLAESGRSRFVPLMRSEE